MVRFLVKRPIGTTMVYLAIIWLGILASRSLPVSLLPDVDIPKITIQVSYQQFSPDQIEKNILKPLRNELLQVLSLSDIQSEAQAGQGVIQLSFDFGTNTDYAALEVNEKIDGIMGRMPEGMARPKVIKASAVDIPVFTLNLSSLNAQKNPQKFLELSDFADMVIKRRIEQIPEVAFVDISGLSFPEVRIIPDTSKVFQLGFKLNDISTSISNNNQEFGSIIVRSGQYQYNVKIGNSLIDIEDVRNIPLRKGSRIYLLQDLADIVLAPKKDIGIYDANGERAIALSILKQSDARIEDMSEVVKETVTQLKREYPELDFELTRDQSQLLTVTIDSLQQSLLIGGLMAFLVLFLFLKDIRSPFLIGLSIPVALIASLLFFQLFGISINIISLSGLLLGIGMMIDNSIIVIDNITQYMQRGKPLEDSCVLGTEEVFRPLLSSVFTTCAVFIPLVFLSGISGTLFFDQAMAVTICLFTSLFVSVTIIPVHFRIFFQSKRLSSWNQKLRPNRKPAFKNFYTRGHHWVIKRQLLMVFLFLLILGVGYPLYQQLEKERFPKFSEDSSYLKINWNEGINLDENRRRILEIVEPNLSSIEQFNVMIGRQQFLLSQEATGMSSFEAQLYFLSEDPNALSDIKSKISTHIRSNYPLASFEFKSATNAFQRVFSSDQVGLEARLSFKSASESDFEKILSLQSSLEIALPSTTRLTTEQNFEIYPNHENLLLYHVSLTQLIKKLRTLLNENTIGELKSFQRFTEIKVSEGNEDFIRQLETVHITNQENRSIPLKYLISTRFSEAGNIVYGDEDGPYFPYKYDIQGEDLTITMNKITELVSQTADLQVNFTGSLLQNEQLIKELSIVLIVALVLLYFILAAQFESVWQPFIILLEVPLNIIATFGGLYLMGASLNIISLIGIVVMSGVIVNDSILKIDTINSLRKEGHSVKEATAIGGERRLKPILMTSITTILALIPFLIFDDLGSELQKPLAIAIISGMLLGTFVSLFYIPLFYSWLVRDRKPKTTH